MQPRILQHPQSPVYLSGLSSIICRGPAFLQLLHYLKNTTFLPSSMGTMVSCCLNVKTSNDSAFAAEAIHKHSQDFNQLICWNIISFLSSSCIGLDAATQPFDIEIKNLS